MKKYHYINIFLISVFLTLSCKSPNQESLKTLKFSISEEIPVPEPSGLDLSNDEKAFWIVSDQNSKVYLIDSWGKEIKSFKVDGEDLEGITAINDTTIAVILERTREVVILDTSGKEIRRSALKLNGELNSGLEGITYNPKEKKFYLLNEKKPRLFLVLDENLNELSRDTLKFAKDFSGIFFNDVDNTLWMLSDESQRIFKTDLAGNISAEFKVNVTQPEGITLNKTRTKLYLVSDVTGNLYVFDLSELNN